IMILLLSLLLTLTRFASGSQEPLSPPVAAARVEIVLFSDFQCPYCAQLARSLRELQSKGVSGVQLSVKFKHFPLALHPAAPRLHLAALAAGEQGKFWEMHDLLFSNRSATGRDDLTGYAAGLGLDLERFSNDLESDLLKRVIETDMAEGERL